MLYQNVVQHYSIPYMHTGDAQLSIFIHNAPCHREESLTEYLKCEHIELMAGLVKAMIRIKLKV